MKDEIISSKCGDGSPSEKMKIEDVDNHAYAVVDASIVKEN